MLAACPSPPTSSRWPRRSPWPMRWWRARPSTTTSECSSSRGQWPPGRACVQQRPSVDVDVLVDPMRRGLLAREPRRPGLGRREPLSLADRPAPALADPPARVVAVRARPARPLPGLLRRPAGRLRGALGPAYDGPRGRAGRARARPRRARAGPRAALPARPARAVAPGRPPRPRAAPRGSTSTPPTSATWPAWPVPSVPRTRPRRSSAPSALRRPGWARRPPPTCGPGGCGPSPPTAPP